MEFMPHGHCYYWEPGLVWLQVLSNGAIGLAYTWIALLLALLVWRGKELPFKGLALGFALFIVSCGVTHFFDVVVIWHPLYWVDGSIRALTAAVSLATAVLLAPRVNQALGLARAAQAARERGVELEHMVDELGELYARTRELDRLKTRFFANVSHELRTPLTLILGPAERLLEAGGLADEQRRDLEVIARNGRTLLKHVNDLLDVARLEAGKLTPAYREVDLARLVRRAASHFEALSRDLGTTLTEEGDAAGRAGPVVATGGGSSACRSGPCGGTR